MLYKCYFEKAELFGKGWRIRRWRYLASKHRTKCSLSFLSLSHVNCFNGLATPRNFASHFKAENMHHFTMRYKVRISEQFLLRLNTLQFWNWNHKKVLYEM